MYSYIYYITVAASYACAELFADGASPALASAPPSCAFVVSPSGDDASPGTEARPFRTLARAAAALRGVPRPLLTDTFACLRDGVYAEALSLTAADSGSGPDAKTGLVAWPGETPTLTGSVPVSFSPLPAGDPAWAHLPAGVGSRVLSAPLPTGVDAGEWTSQGGFEGCTGPPLELLLGTEAQEPARWPNAQPEEWGGPWAMTTPTWHSSPDSFGTDPATTAFLEWTDLSDVWVHGHFLWDWNDRYMRVSSVDAATGLVHVAAPYLPTGNISGAARFYALNSLSALDAEREFYLNRSSRVLYYLPPASSPAGEGASVSSLPTLIYGSGVSHFVVQGLTLWGSRGTAVYFSPCGTGLSIVNNTIPHAGLAGIDIYGTCTDILVQGNVVHHTGGHGVSVGGDDGGRATLTPSRRHIADNTVHDFERVCFTYAFGLAVEGTGAVVERNEVFNSGHSGATIRGNDVLFRWNILHHLTMDTFDNAGLYFEPNDWSMQNITLFENFAYLNGDHATPCNFRTSCLRASLYMDNGGAGLNVVSNIIWQPLRWTPLVDEWHHAPLWVAVNDDGGRNTVITNNLIIDSVNVTYNSGGGLAWPSFGQQDNSSSLYAEMRAVHWNEGVFARAYPALAELQDYYAPAPRCADNPRCPPAPYGNSVVRNVVVNASGVILIPPQADVFNASHFDVSNNLRTDDPGWVAADPRATLDFRLRPDSPAFTALDPPFVRIHSECFGPWSGCV